MAFSFFKNQMDIDRGKYQKVVERNKRNGSKGGRPSKEINTILDLLEHCEEGAEKVRQMQKLDVILMRVQNRRARSVAINENDPYYEKVVRRVTLLKNGRR